MNRCENETTEEICNRITEDREKELAKWIEDALKESQK